MRTYAWVSIALYLIWLVLVLLRIALMWAKTSTTGIRPVSQGPLSADAAARMLMFAALGAGFAAPVVVVTDRMGTVTALTADPVQIVGAVLAAVGIAATTAAQLGMGTSWRIGVDPAERTELVTGGLFSVVRNPVYTSMTVAVAGLALLVPNLLSLVSVVLLVVGVQVLVRGVEEPYMLRAHGRAYADYAARVGRFLPSVGRLGT